MDVVKNEPSAIVEKNDTILDKFFDDLKDNVDEHNKVKINEFNSPSFYLPPLSKIFALIGFVQNQKQLIDLCEATYEKPLKISRTSKYDFFNKGVGLRTASKIISWLKIIPLPFEQLATKRMMAKLTRSGRAGSNAGSWLSGISSFEAGYKDSRNKNKHEFTTLFSFIEQRCNTEVDLLLRAKADIKSGELNRDDIAAVWQAQQPLWENNPCIPSQVIENFAELMKLHQQKVSLSEQQTLSLIESYLYLYFDFFIEVITHYEVGCRILYGQNEEKIKNELGMITKAIHAFATQENIKTCFAGMLQEFKDALSESVGETGYRKLATFIEIEESELNVSGESMEDKQYKQLKDWRNGENLPSGDKLTAFLQNLDTYAKTDSGLLTFDMCRVTMAMDKLTNELLNQTKNDNCSRGDVGVVIKKVLSNIPDYYRKNLKTELEKKEPTT